MQKPKPFEKGSVEWDLFTIFFNLCKKYWEPDLNDPDGYWDGFIHDVAQLYEKKFQPFGRMLAKVLLAYLENKFKEVQKDADA